MSSGTFTWCGIPIGFVEGESVAAAISRANRFDLGTDGSGVRLRYFCGIGACQNCLVRIEGATVEACLTPARPGISVQSLGGGDD